MTKDVSIHPTADVQSDSLGRGTRVWQFVVILPGARIGEDANICSHCFIENDVLIGDRATVKSGVHLWDGIRIADDVFIGPGAVFANDRFPRSKQYPEEYLQTHIERGASVGAGAVILPGLTIGAGAIVGAGAVVTRSVPPHAIVTGSPARITGYVDAEPVMSEEGGSTFMEPLGQPGSIPLGVRGVTLHRLKLVHDMRGDLSVGEFPGEIPFEPKRYFMVFNVPSEKTRGAHAHRTCHQFLTCIRGSCAVVVDDGTTRCEVVLDSPDLGIYLPPMTWGIQYRYTSDAVLLIFASHAYDPDDYIRDYGEFVSAVRN